MFSCNVVERPESVSEIVSRNNVLNLDSAGENLKHFNIHNFGFIFSFVL
jgi:hypothetical protein